MEEIEKKYFNNREKSLKTFYENLEKETQKDLENLKNKGFSYHFDGKYLIIDNEIDSYIKVAGYNKFTKAYVKCKCCGKVTLKNIYSFRKQEKIERICKSCSLLTKSEIEKIKIKEKRKQTNLEKYGVENAYLNKDVQEKAKQTFLKNYGVEHPWASESVKNKIKETHAQKTEEQKIEIIEKRKATCLKKYGYSCVTQVPYIKEKSEKTCLQRYGKRSVLQLEKTRQALKDKYQVENISQSNYWKHKHLQNALSRIDFSKFNLEKVYKENGDICAACKVCGNVFDISHDKNKRIDFNCYVCNPEGKSPCSNDDERIIYSIFSKHCKVKCHDRKEIAPLELDFYIPEKRVAIECDGIYWHSFREKDHLNNKTVLCEEKDISLLHIYDYEIHNKLDIITSILKSKLRINNDAEKVFARKCEIKEVSYNDYKTFCIENHLQGSAMAKIRLGLYFNNNLIQIMSFTKPRFNKKYEWELIRECTKLNYYVVGGKEKLFNYFKKLYSPKSIISYCDRRFFKGESYIKLGFKKLYETAPSYFYYNGKKLLSRFACQKKKLPNLLGEKFNNNLTEYENMTNNNFIRIYDCGENVFIWQK